MCRLYEGRKLQKNIRNRHLLTVKRGPRERDGCESWSVENLPLSKEEVWSILEGRRVDHMHCGSEIKWGTTGDLGFSNWNPIHSGRVKHLSLTFKDTGLEEARWDLSKMIWEILWVERTSYSNNGVWGDLHVAFDQSCLRWMSRGGGGWMSAAVSQAEWITDTKVLRC